MIYRMIAMALFPPGKGPEFLILTWQQLAEIILMTLLSWNLILFLKATPSHSVMYSVRKSIMDLSAVAIMMPSDFLFPAPELVAPIPMVQITLPLFPDQTLLWRLPSIH